MPASRFALFSPRTTIWPALATLVACSGGGGGASVPIAAPDAYVYQTTNTLTIAAPGVMSNDSVTSATAVLVGSPAHASAFTLNANGSFTYTSADGTSSDAFSYKITDANGSSNVVQVSLAPNQPPTAVNACRPTPINTSLSGTLTANDEPASQPDVFALVSDPTVGPYKGTVVVNPNGTFTYTPNNPNFVGMDKFKFRVTDFNGTGLSSTGIATVLINGAVRIMPLGDSITQGVATAGACDVDGSCPARTSRISYRYKLLTDLTNPALTYYPVTLVGGLHDGSAAGLSADDTHDGHPGFCPGPSFDSIWCTATSTTDIYLQGGIQRNLSSNIVNWLNANQTDIILLHAGTNGLGTGANAAQDVQTLLNNINTWAASNYPVTVFVARIIPAEAIAPATTGSLDVQTFNNAVQTMVGSTGWANLKVYMVDQQSVLADLAVDSTGNTAKASLMASEFHPNQTGYDLMASKWETALTTAHPGLLPTGCP